MADRFDCDVNQGFSFKKDSTSTHGFVEELEIGGTALPASFKLAFPDEDGAQEVVGVLRYFDWDGDKQHPFELEIQVSNEAKQIVKQLTDSTMTDDKIDIKFRIYDFDSDKKKYYPTFITMGSAKGIINKEINGTSTTRKLNVAPKPSTEIPQPENYLVRLTIDPQGESKVTTATSDSGKLVKVWGM